MASTVSARDYKGAADLVTHSLRADGFDASEDGTGRGTPLVPVDVMTLAIRGRGDSHNLEHRSDGTANAILTPNGGRGGIGVGAIAFDTTQITHPANHSHPRAGDPCHPLASGAHPPAIAFSAKDHGGDAMVDCSPTLRAGGFTESHANAGVMPAIAFAASNYESGEFEQCETARPLTTSVDRTRAAPIVGTMQVRRLTPCECERLQGFPDDYTLIDYRGKPAADGPRYKALGNSMAVPVMAWIGQRIAMVEAIRAEEVAA